jgi:uncharacterized membrane protein YccC
MPDDVSLQMPGPLGRARAESHRLAIFDARRLKEALRAAGPPLLFGIRLWVSVCVALYVAFWLELDQPSWAGTTAAIVCQPRLGASLRKGWFRMIGTPVGAVAIVALTACFPQDRCLFLLGLALWGAMCAFASTILRNYAAYAAALAGYTSVIIASDQLGAIGGPDGEAFMLAVTRVTEIGIGIVSAGVVLAGTDLGGARRRLAAVFAALTAGIAANFARTLMATGPELAETQPIRRDLLRRIIALDPVIDETLGESTQIRYHSPVLQRAVDGLVGALASWRVVANHLSRLPVGQGRAEAAVILRALPAELLSLLKHPDPTRWTADPTGVHRTCEGAAHQLIAFPAGTPELRMLADKTAEALAGLSHALNGLALLVADPARPVSRHSGVFRLRVPDWLPAAVNAARTVVTIGAVALFWTVSAWPSGALAVTWAAISVILFAPRADQAYATAMSFLVGSGLAALAAAIIAFAVLPGLESFAAFSLVLGAWLVPTGAAAAQPWQRVAFSYMSGYFVPLLAPTNPMSYDAVQFYNSVLASLAGAGAAALAFRLIPPLSPAFRTQRLRALTLRDLRRLAMGRPFNDWEGHIHDRLSAMPAEATPLQRAEILAALSLGTELDLLRPVARRLELDVDLESALAAVAQGKSMVAAASFSRLDAALADHAATEPDALRGRGSILVISEVLAQHAGYFDEGTPR